MTAIQKRLQDLEKSGKFLFHGSGYKLDILTPHQAHNFTEDKIYVPDDKPGIHATPNSDIAIFMAIFSKPNMPKELHTSFGNDGDTLLFRASKETLDQLHANTAGYVYVVDKKEFTKRSAFEYISYQEIKPISIITVTKQELPKNISILI